MTDQASDELINEHPDIDLGDLRLYGIIKSDPPIIYESTEYYETVSKPEPDKSTIICSGCWRGYISHYRLNTDGELILEKYEYLSDPYGIPILSDAINEPLKGAFWLSMRKCFDCKSTYIPFRSGKIVTDKNEWRGEINDIYSSITTDTGSYSSLPWYMGKYALDRYNLEIKETSGKEFNYIMEYFEEGDVVHYLGVSFQLRSPNKLIRRIVSSRNSKEINEKSIFEDIASADITTNQLGEGSSLFKKLTNGRDVVTIITDGIDMLGREVCV